MQLEMAVTGHISSVADDFYVRTLGSPVLMEAVKGSSHQLQELASELGALFLVRRRLQEMYDEEEAQRRLKVRQHRHIIHYTSSQRTHIQPLSLSSFTCTCLPAASLSFVCVCVCMYVCM